MSVGINMIKINAKENCCGCYACYDICPKQCITMKIDNEGFWYPDIDKDKCVNCNLCEKVCPVINKPEISVYKRAGYAMFNKNEEIRIKSSSGGIFSLLADFVISSEGKVYGAVFDEKFNVKHVGIDNSKDISLLRGSKYVQSKIDEVFKLVKSDLEAGKLVLFTGTPCQIAGLKSFLRKDYDNLILMDIVCHGVPSPLVWQRYLNNLKEKYKQNIKRIYFRDKSTGWKRYSVQIVFDNNKYKEIGLDNIYMRGFIGNIYLRPSCYACKFKGIERISDITVADFWGIQKINPQMDDDKGTSFVIIQSKKGQTVFEAIKNSIKFKSVDIKESLKYNVSALQPVMYNDKRDKFFAELSTDKNVDDLIKKYTKMSIWRKIKQKIKYLIKLKR